MREEAAELRPRPVLVEPYVQPQLTNVQQFVTKLTKSKYTNRVSDKGANAIATTVLMHIREQMENGTLDCDSLDAYIQLTSSIYRQRKELNEALHYDKYLREHTFDHGGKFYSIDLRESIKSYLNDPEIMESIWKEKNARNDPEWIKSFRCNEEFSEEVDDKTIVMYLQVYFDDFDTSKHGGSKHTKLSTVYLTFSNLPYAKQSKRDEILLSLLCKRSDIKNRQNLEQFFEPLANSINSINDDPIKLTDGYKVKVCVCCVVADNPASNELHKICRSFRWNACKFCEIYLDQIREYNANRMDAEERPMNPEHIFRDVWYIGRLFAPDIFHDLNEGVVPVLTNAILKKITRENRATIEHDCKTKFKKYLANGLVSGIVNAQVGGSGAQKMDFFMILPFVNNYFSKSSSLWKLYLLLRRIICVCFSTQMMQIDLDQFEIECRKFNNIFFKMFETNNNAPFKVHHIKHYPTAIRWFGPLFFLSTLRYERVHQLLGRLVSTSQNFITQPKQISERWALMSLINLNENQQPIQDDIFEIYSTDEIRSNVYPSLHPFIDFEQELVILNKTEINDLEIEPEAIYLYEFAQTVSNPLPLFVIICHIIKQGQEIKLIGKAIHSTSYFPSLDIYKVEQNQNLVIIDANQIKYHKSYQIINTSLGNMINRTFYVPLEIYGKYCEEIEFESLGAQEANLEAVSNDPYQNEDED